LLHRAAAPRFAIADRSSGVSFAARAFPPLAPPSFPKATAAGFFSGPFGAGSGAASPVAMSTTILASWFGSRGMLERFCMLRLWASGSEASTAVPLKLRHYRPLHPFD